MEDIETIEGRAPGDVDVVTFCYRPAATADDAAWQALLAANSGLVDPNQVRSSFKCHAFFVDLNILPASIVDQTRYWFGLFSHRRGGLWKGMLQVRLNVSTDDADASAIVGSLP